MKLWLILLSFTLLPIVSRPQNCVSLLTGTSFGMSHGSAQVTAITTDISGNVWIGVGSAILNYGVGMFDGSVWTVWTTTQGLPSNRISALTADDAGNIWAGTSQGLAKWNGASWQSFTTSDGLPSNIVQCLDTDASGNLWIGTANGLARYNGITFLVYTTTDNLPANNITTIHCQGDTVWVGTNQGAGRFAGGGWVQYTSLNSAIQSNQINGITSGSNGKVWIATLLGLVRFSPSDSVNLTTLNSPIPDNNVTRLTSLGSTIWMTSGSSLTSFDGVTWASYTGANSGLPLNIPSILSTDNNGSTLWFGFEYSAGPLDFPGIGKITQIVPFAPEVTASNGTILCLGEETVLDAGSGFTSYYWNSGSSNQSITVDNNGIYTVYVTDGTGCYDYDTVSVIVKRPYENESICAVTVLKSEYNLIAWEKTYGQGTDFYNVYKEDTVIGTYMQIGTVSFDSLSIFIDSLSRPKKFPDRYRISVIDSCGNESALSPPHRSIRLRVNVGGGGQVDLEWTGYEGQLFNNYDVLRGTDTTLLSNVFSPLSTIGAWLDPNIPAGAMYYQLSVNLNELCSPSVFKDNGGPYSQSVSNIEDNLADVSVTEFFNNSVVKVWPVPFQRNLSLESSLQGNFQYSVTDISGKIICSGIIAFPGTITISLPDIENGTYLLSLDGDKIFRKLILKN